MLVSIKIIKFLSIYMCELIIPVHAKGCFKINTYAAHSSHEHRRM